jgi:hypothetical protein
MSSEVKANKVSPATGTDFTFGDSGDTFTVPSGATLAVASGATITNSGTATGFSSGDNTPAFQAYLSANLTLANGTWTKFPCNTEDFDTDSAYDSATNYRFTVPAGEGGKYYFYANANILYGGGAVNTGVSFTLQIRINSETNTTASFANTNKGGYALNWEYGDVAGITTLSAADTVEFYVQSVTYSGYNSALQAGSYLRNTHVGGYKMIGL